MQGYLKKNVNVIFSGDVVRITYALWEVSLPAKWVYSRPVVRELLERKRSRDDAMVDTDAGHLVQLLEAQGCFAPIAKASYSLREVRALFDPLRSEWYATYYAHSIWGRIRTGQASRNELLAWMMHNYHISRAAGVVGARMAAIGKKSDWRAFFENDALDEYWHCDAYYFIDSPDLQMSAADAKAYVPLPSSLAFEQHTLQVAETDPLAHVLIAYFQESSVVFEDDCSDFYRAVESTYGLPNFFKSWKQHIRIDVEHHHAEGLSHLLDSDAEVDAATVTNSLRNAWLAFSFFRSSLDEIRAEAREGQGTLARAPILRGRLDPSLTALVPGFIDRIYCSERVFTDLQMLYEWYTVAIDRGVKDMRGLDDPEVRISYLRHGMARSAFRALGFARDHDEVIGCGRVANMLSVSSEPPDASQLIGPWEVAIVNYLLEAATCPAGWSMFVDLLLLRLNELRALVTEQRPHRETPAITHALRRATVLTPFASDRWLTALLQFDELIARWTSTSEHIPNNLLNE